MKLNYKLGELIRNIDVKNKDLHCNNLKGLSMTKEFRASTSNIVGTDLSKYKIVAYKQFACDFMSAIRVHKMPIAFNSEMEEILVSPAYAVFEVIDENIILPEYLMMRFRRSEFDRYADFRSDAAIRGGYGWNELCETEIKLPSLEEQRKKVQAYKTITDRIELKKKINDNLDDTAQTLYQKYFESNSDKSSWKQGTVGDVLQLQRGHDLPRTEMTGGKYPVAGSTGTIGYHDEFTAEAPVIVMGRSGNIGNPRLYLCNCWTHNTSLYVKQIYEAEPLWVFYLLKNLNYDGFVGGSAVPTLNRNDVHAYGIAIPPLELQKSFSQKVMSLIYCKEENLSEIEKLQELQKIILTTMSSR